MKNRRWASIIIVLALLLASAAIAKDTRFITFDERTGIDRFGKELSATGDRVFSDYKSAFDLGDLDDMRVTKSETDALGFTHYRYQQYYNGIKVEGVQYIVHERNGKAEKGNGAIVVGINTDISPVLGEDQARDLALKSVSVTKWAWQDATMENFKKRYDDDPNATYYPKGELVLVNPADGKGSASDYVLAYKFDVYAAEPLSREYIYIDAHNGGVVKHLNRIQDFCNTFFDTPGTVSTRYNGTQSVTVWNSLLDYDLSQCARGITAYNCGNQLSYPQVGWSSSTPNFSSDNVAGGAYWAAEKTYDYFKNVLGYNYGFQPQPWKQFFVHYDSAYNNAFWNGGFFVFGDGDGTTHRPYVALECVGHEYTHAITEYSANLEYQSESGALNESFSDIIGTAVEFNVGMSPDWLIGEDYVINSNGNAFSRSMSNPNAASDPDTYHGTFWHSGSGDNGGVHTNSGVQNFWFYLLSQGGSGTNDNGQALFCNWYWNF